MSSGRMIPTSILSSDSGTGVVAIGTISGSGGGKVTLRSSPGGGVVDWASRAAVTEHSAKWTAYPPFFYQWWCMETISILAMSMYTVFNKKTTHVEAYWNKVKCCFKRICVTIDEWFNARTSTCGMSDSARLPSWHSITSCAPSPTSIQWLKLSIILPSTLLHNN